MMDDFNTAYIGVGANLGDPIQQISDARFALCRLPETQSLRSSSLYCSSPVGYRDQPDFINAVFEIVTSTSAISLFTSMQEIETSLGRERDPSNQNAARTIDLDLLLFADQKIQTKQLTVPHPRMTERLFVLKPLAELAPELDVLHSLDADFGEQKLHQIDVQLSN